MTTNEQWAKLYQYLDKRFGAVDDKFDVINKRFEEVITTIANLAGRVDDDDTERAAISSELGRHDIRIKRLEQISCSRHCFGR